MKDREIKLKPLRKGFKRPLEDRKIEFTDIFGEVFKGKFIKEEDLFFIGFGLAGDFRFAYQIHEWAYYQATI